MESPSKNDILAASSGWVATSLNFFPGLGVGYIYQRRWIQYFITIAFAIVWFLVGSFFENSQTEPTQLEKIIGLGGFLIISLTTMIEANFAHRNSMKLLQEEKKYKDEKPKKKRGVFGIAWSL